jgi:hypothetical protein
VRARHGGPRESSKWRILVSAELCGGFFSHRVKWITGQSRRWRHFYRYVELELCTLQMLADLMRISVGS